MATREPQGESFLNQTPARARPVGEESGPHIDPEDLLQVTIEKNLDDPWRHRAVGMRCKTCMFYVAKATYDLASDKELVSTLGRCRRRAPTMSGYPAVFTTDWCGDHKLDENK
jgi:hypothetical protein